MENLIAITWWLRLLILAAGSLFIASLLLKIRELGVHPFREITRLVRRPWFEAVLLIFFVGGLVQYGATKGTNGADRSQLMGLMRSPAPTIAPIAADLTRFSLPTNFPAVTNLCFWGIEHGDETVSLGIAWPPAMSFTNDCIDIFGCHRLTSNGWWRLAQLDVGQIGSNAIVELAYVDLPTNAMCVSAFYRLASQDDSDGDGLTDKVEEWVLGTDPVLFDTDNDGLSDAAEVDFEVDPRSGDSDSDGLSDGDEVGYIQVADCFVWYDTSALSPTYNTGYWNEKMSKDISGWWCQVASRPIYSSHNVIGLPLTYLTAFETGYIAFSSVGDFNGWVFPPGPTALNRDVWNSGSILVAAYWNEAYLCKGDTNSYIRAGTVSDGTYVVEFHDVRTAPYSTMGMTYQVSVPSGTGNVIRVSYLSSDYWMDGEGAVVGVQNKRIVTTNGYYNLTWDFSERGPILPRTTVEYHLGYGTSPLCKDSDGDGLSDDFEINVFHSNPFLPDEDGDGLLDAVEYSQGTNPKSADSDGDGLPDKWEVDYGLCPTNSAADDGRTGDFDNDGLTNWQEYQEGCDPGNRDTDGDGVDDGEESTAGTSPLLSDSDYDGLSDLQEGTIGTNPTQPDTDGDGMNDGWEWSYRGALLLTGNTGSATTFNPLVHNSNDSDPNNDYSADPDGDGLTNGQESDMGTNPNIADTDGDGVNDAAEVAQSSDPNDAADLGVANSRVNVSFCFGDHSGSHSEKYCLRLTPVAGSGIGTTPRTLSYVNANYGECETKTVVLVPGWKYEITLGHAGTNLTEGPDYDYTLTCTPPARVLLNDAEGLFGVDDTSTRFAANGKVAHMYVLDFKFVTPAGDPVDSPVSASIRGQNEFTYVDVTSSLALMPHVQVLPTLTDELAATLNGQFTLPSITGAQLIWENGGGGAGTTENQEGFGDPPVTTTEFAARVTYQGYPTHNSGFGRKTMAFTCRGVTITQDFEVFFPKFGTHHPSCTTCPGCPNWFYYWRDGGVCSIPNNARWAEATGAHAADMGWYLNGQIFLTNLAAGEENEFFVNADFKITNCAYNVGMEVCTNGMTLDVSANSTGVAGARYFVQEIPSVESIRVENLRVGGRGKGIGCVAAVCRHELCHKTMREDLAIRLQNWVEFEYDEAYAERYGLDSKEYAEMVLAYKVCKYENADLDLQRGDGVVDLLERSGYYGLKSDVNNRDTYAFSAFFDGDVYDDYGDEEIRCRHIEALSLETRYHDNIDWCSPGCQHSNRYGPLR